MRLFSTKHSKFRHALTVASVLCLLILLPVVLLWSAGTAPASASKMGATADSQCFPAAADSFVDEATPETNYGEAEALQVRAAETLARTYVRFDLSEIPEEATIEQALLRLYLQGSETSEVATVLRAAAEPWEEYGIYWDIQPERVGTFDERVHEAGEGSYKEWNATELVAEWISGSLENYGLVVVPNDAPLYTEFSAREAGADRVPLLCVEWSVPDTPTPVPPTPTPTPSPACGKHLALRPDWGGKGAAVHATGCGWTPGADVDIVWDDPQGVLATTKADSGGNISVLFQLPATDNEFFSPPGQHTVTATEPAGSMVATANFTQTARQLHLVPYRGPGTLSVDVRGCGWAGDPEPFLYWSGPPGDPPQNVGQIPIDPGSGCLEGSFDVPEHPAGIYQTVATTRSTYYTGTGSTASAFKIHYPYVTLTPPEGPPGSHLPVESCHWYPNEDVNFTWHPTGTQLINWSTDGNGCVWWSSSPDDAYVPIPTTATLGTHVVQATGVSSNLTTTVQVEVMNPQLNLSPDHGTNGDIITADGCGWVGNDRVTIEWGYPDTNNQPIAWYSLVDQDIGCYSRAITVPTNTPAGTFTTTATGQDSGKATELFTVTHPGTVEVPDISSAAGYSLTVKGYDWKLGETVFYSWDEGPSQPFAGGGVTRADGRFTHTIQLPKYASVGGHSLTVTGTKGGDTSAGVLILDDAKIQMPNLLDVGTSPTVTGIDWAAGERVTLELTDTNGTGRYFGSVTIPSGTLDFTQKITVGTSIPFGPATFEADGDKGEDVTKSVRVTDTIPPTIVNVFQQPNPMPTNRTMQLYAKATDNDRYPDIIELAVGGTVEGRCYNTTECRETGITLTAGTHNYTVTAYDDADNQTSKVGQVIAYRTDEAPTVTVSHTPFNPSGGQTIDVTAVVTDMQGGVKAMTITVGGRSPQTFTFSAPYPNTVTRHFHYKPQWLGQFGVKYHATVEDAGGLTTRSGPRWALFDNTGADSDNDGIDDDIELHFLCTDWNDPDSDEDGLRDGWEILGRHFSDGDSVNLHKMGANPCRKDVFVQYDYERGTYIGDSAIQNVVNTFQDHNVTLHVDTNERPHTGSTTSPTSTLKAETASYQTDSNGNYYFDPKRNWTHKYIYSHHRQGRSSAWHYVTLDIYAGSNWNCPPSPDPTTNPQCNQGRRSPYDLQYRFIHELGHHLGMGHGGRGGSGTQKTNGDLVYYEGNWNNTNYKPHYVGVMNYRYSYNTGCYNASRNDWASDLDYQAANFGTLDENDLDERDSANASLFAFRSCGGSGYEPVVRYRCTDPDEGGKRYVMISNGTTTLARKPASGSFTTTVPSQIGQGVDWDCDGTIESSVSENINTPLGEICGDNKDNNNNGATNEGCGKSKLRSPDDWNDIPTGRSCLGWKVQPKTYRNDIDAPSCTSMLGISQDEVHTHEDETFTLDPNTEVCNGYDTDGDGQIDEGCPDSDGDAIIDAIDNCPTVANADQANNDGDYRGAACEMPPSPPVGLSAEVTDAGIVLSWSAPDRGTPATGYNVYRRHHGDGGFRFVGEFPTTNSTNYTDTVENAGDYTYVVRAVNRYGEEGNRSEPASVSVTGYVYIPVVIR